MAKEVPFVPPTPTVTFSVTVGTATVTRQLFGPVSDARYAAEKRDARHRAEQLDMTPIYAERKAREARENSVINGGWRNQIIDQYEEWNAA